MKRLAELYVTITVLHSLVARGQLHIASHLEGAGYALESYPLDDLIGKPS